MSPPSDDERRADYRRTADRMHPDVELLHRAWQSTDDRLTDLRSAVETLVESNSPKALRTVIVDALREAANDPEITQALYDTMTLHARRALADYIMKRVITAVVTLVISAALAWSYIKGLAK
jgi:hypothetical protein